MPEDGPLGETFLDASDRAMTVALLLKSPSGGWVESVVTFFTHRFFAGSFFAEAFDFLGEELDRVVIVVLRDELEPQSGIFGSVLLEVLDFALVLARFFQGRKRSEIAALACGGVFLAGIEAVFTGP